MKWYSVDVSVDRLREGMLHRLCRAFQRAFIANGAPDAMALFAEAVPSDGSRRMYFSPGSTSYVQPLIDECGGRPCDPPAESGLTLVFGVPGTEAAMFSSGDGTAGSEPAAPGYEIAGVEPKLPGDYPQ